MGWNQQGGNGGGQDPWGGNRGGNDGPPDLDEIVRKLQDKFGGLFNGGGGKGGGGSKAGSGMGPEAAGIGVGLILVVGLFAWMAFGFYTVDQAEEGVVLRFGKYIKIAEPGWHWRFPPPIDDVIKVNVSEIRNAEIGYRSGGQSVPREALMLTQDENIIDITFAVQYQIKDSQKYLFNVRNPDISLRNATESAIREIVGKSKMDFVLTGGRGQIASDSKVLIQEILDRYQTGLLITSVNTQQSQAPAQVKDAFDDATKAREDLVRKKNEAEAYANDILPKARGDAERLRQQAQGYKAQVIAYAEGETSRFTQVLKEYEKAPDITRERLYIEAMESVLGNSSKILIDNKAGGANNLMYLPLDKLMDNNRSSSPRISNNDNADSSDATPGANSDALRRLRESLRQKGRQDLRSRRER